MFSGRLYLIRRIAFRSPLRSVVRVDAYIIMGQIASPGDRFRFAHMHIGDDKLAVSDMGKLMIKYGYANN